MDFALFLLTSIVICLVVGVCSSTDYDVNSAMLPPFLKSSHEPRRGLGSTGRLVRTVPGYMRWLYKQQNSNIFSEVSCILSQDYKPRLIEHPWLTFDLSNVGNLQTASMVTLRVFKRRPKFRVAKQLYVIHLYEVQRLEDNNSSVGDQVIVSSRVVDNWRGEWLSFDVTSQIKVPLETTSKHFLVNIKPFNQNSTSKPVTIGMLGPKRAMLLVFHKKNFNKNKKTKSLEMGVLSAGMSRFPRDVSSSGGGRQYCRRHRLYINFHDLGRSEMIIAPRGYSAYYCRGECPVMLGQSMNPSHYSIIRNLYKVVTHNNDIPSACCVPTELKSITILYFDENKNVILKEVPDMSVTSCGCR